MDFSIKRKLDGTPQYVAYKNKKYMPLFFSLINGLIRWNQQPTMRSFWISLPDTELLAEYLEKGYIDLKGYSKSNLLELLRSAMYGNKLLASLDKIDIDVTDKALEIYKWVKKLDSKDAKDLLTQGALESQEHSIRYFKNQIKLEEDPKKIAKLKFKIGWIEDNIRKLEGGSNVN